MELKLSLSIMQSFYTRKISRTHRSEFAVRRAAQQLGIARMDGSLAITPKQIKILKKYPLANIDLFY